MSRILSILALLIVASATSFPVLAHTTVRSSTPASGSVLTQSPPMFELVFAERVRLTSLILISSAGERRLTFKPATSALRFTAARPGFAVGRNEIRWTALSQDGHVITGTIIVVMRKPAR